MAGVTKKFKDGQIIFRKGDPSSGMYIIRSGSVEVYLEEDGKVVTLGHAEAGGILGEISFFDKKDRSASAKAVGSCELSWISSDEFDKVVKTIPKWFVALMGTISSRLRETNQYLQEVDNDFREKSDPMEEVIKSLNMLYLLGYKAGRPTGKGWTMDRNVAGKKLAKILSRDTKFTDSIIETLCWGKILKEQMRDGKKKIIQLENRHDLERLVDMVTELKRRSTNLKTVSISVIEMIELLSKAALAVPYDTYSTTLGKLLKEGSEKGFKTDRWPEVAETMIDLDDSLLITKSGQDLSIKVQKLQITQILQFAKVLRALTKSDKFISKLAA